MINFVLGLWLAWVLVSLVLVIPRLFSKKENPFDQLSYLTLIWLEKRTRDYDLVQWRGKIHSEIKEACKRKKNFNIKGTISCRFKGSQ